MQILLYNTIVLLITVLFIILYIIFREQSLKQIKDQEFIVCIKTLELILNTYKSTVLEPKLQEFVKTHDLDSASPTNAIKAHRVKMEELYTLCAKDIIKIQICPNMRIHLLKYFSYDSLILFILTHLKNS